MPKDETYTRERLEAAIAKMPLVWHEQIVPPPPGPDPDTGQGIMIPDQFELVADFRMRMPLRMPLRMDETVVRRDGTLRTHNELRALAKRNLEDFMHRMLFEFVTGQTDWPKL